MSNNSISIDQWLQELQSLEKGIPAGVFRTVDVAHKAGKSVNWAKIKLRDLQIEGIVKFAGFFKIRDFTGIMRPIPFYSYVKNRPKLGPVASILDDFGEPLEGRSRNKRGAARARRPRR